MKMIQVSKSWRLLAIVLVLLLLSKPVSAISYRYFLPPKNDNSHGVPSLYYPAHIGGGYKESSQYVEMTDGTKIAVEIFLPGNLKPGEKVPVIFEQTRYWRVIDLRHPFNLLYTRPLALWRRSFAMHGYGYVTMDARAGGASFGTRPWEFCPIDSEDHKTVTDWILKQPWSNGKIGLLGHSYAGNFAEFGLLHPDPAVKAVAIISSPFDLYIDIMHPGGMTLQPFMHNFESFTKEFDQDRVPKNLKAFNVFIKGVHPVDNDDHLKLLHAAIEEHKMNSDMRVLDKIQFKDDFVFDPKSKNEPTHQLKAFRHSVDVLQQTFGPEFMKRGLDLGSASGYWEKIAQVKVPIYVGAGWFEAANANAAIKRFMNYRNPGNKLILGPWDHNFFNISPYTRGGITRFRFDRELMKFFDYYMKDTSTGVDKDMAVHYYTLGEEQWHASADWPPPGKDYNLYLQSKNKLIDAAPVSENSDHYKVDITARTGKNSRWDCLIGNPLWAPYSDRKKADQKLLTFDSAPLTEDRRITGHPQCTIFVKPSATDCALFAYLEDVAPNGIVRYVSEGQILAGHALAPTSQVTYKTVWPQRGFHHADYAPLTPGANTEVKFELMPISFLFKKGHRIRVALAGADADHFENPPFAKVGDSFDVITGGSSLSKVTLPIDENTH
jgi:putative CocE/NonD family hydrolase